MKAIEMLNMSDGVLALQSLSGTRWPTRSVKLRIVSRCLPAMVDFQDQLTDADSIGLLSAIRDPTFIFAVEFLSKLFLFVNFASEALQRMDKGFAPASKTVEDLKTIIAQMDCADGFEKIYVASVSKCQELGVELEPKGSNKRTRKVPTALQGCLMDRFVVNSSDALLQGKSKSQPSRAVKVTDACGFLPPCIGFNEHSTFKQII